MPLTKAGRKVKGKMAEEYGEERGERVFYASMNARKPGSSGWEKAEHAKRKAK